MKTQKYESLGEMIRDKSVVWYGPHECEGCGECIIKSSVETGGVALDSPHNHHYPNHEWRLHRCKTDGCEVMAQKLVDLSVGKVIRIKSSSPHPHSLWRITGRMEGASQQENLVAIRRLELNPGNNVEGKVQEDSIVPMSLLSTHPAIENV